MGPRVASTGKPGVGAPHTPCSHPAGERGTHLLVRSCCDGVVVLCGTSGYVQVMRRGGRGVEKGGPPAGHFQGPGSPGWRRQVLPPHEDVSPGKKEAGSGKHRRITG